MNFAKFSKNETMLQKHAALISPALLVLLIVACDVSEVLWEEGLS